MSTAVKELLRQKIEFLRDDQVEQLLEKANELFPQPITGQEHKPDWDRVFSNKLTMKEHPYAIDLSEVSGDDFLY
ncbi:MAG TPA: hypothetical protein VGB07_33050 [Blastocatellia bacterium]